MATVLALLLPLLIQDPLRTAEAARVDTMARVMPAVCAIMPLQGQGGGSGVVFDPLGFVLTNYHVVGKSKQMKLGLPDGSLRKAAVLGVDPGSDLAVLLLEGGVKDMPHAPLGDSDDLLVGESVFAMGNPFLLATDFKPTVTAGIVSGTHRYQQGQGDRIMVYPDCIQVDAPVNPGNSGGPLFNARGEIVGINGRISVRDRGRVNTGVGFAIASNQIRNFLADMLAGRHAEHGTLDLNAWFMEAPNEPGRRAVFVQALLGDSIAAKHGVGLGDEITRFNGHDVRSANQLATLVGVLPAQSEVVLGYRAKRVDGGYEAERLVTLNLARLDTGSAQDPDRLAQKEHRQLAAQVFTRRIALDRAAEGTREEGNTRLTRTNETLRVERDGAIYVREAPGRGHKLVGGAQVDLNSEETTMLERIFATNPWLCSGSELATRLAGCTLEGGVFVRGKPAARLRLAGDEEREVWLFHDGKPAGYSYRDPVLKRLLEVR